MQKLLNNPQLLQHSQNSDVLVTEKNSSTAVKCRNNNEINEDLIKEMNVLV